METIHGIGYDVQVCIQVAGPVQTEVGVFSTRIHERLMHGRHRGLELGTDTGRRTASLADVPVHATG